LHVLRRYRDEILMNTSRGRREVEAYHAVAPAIVDAIDRRKNRESFYEHWYQQDVRRAVSAIRVGDHGRVREICMCSIHDACRHYNDQVGKFNARSLRANRPARRG
jgi:hypothetical protein